MLLSASITTDVVSVITNLGFPIACCIFLAFFMREMQNQHKKEIDTLTEKINEHTVTIQKLVDRIDELLRRGE